MLGSICLGAKLLDQEANKLGKVKCLVVDKDKGLLTHLVAEVTFRGYCTKVIEASEIKCLSSEGNLLQLGLYSSEIENLPDYIEHDFSGTDLNYAEVPYTLLAGGGIFPWAFNRPYFPPLPESLTTSEGSILVKQAFLEKVKLPENSLQIHERSYVIGEDGKRLGHLKSLNLEFFSGRIKSFTFKKGLLHENTQTFEWGTVEKVTRDYIQVNLRMNDLKQTQPVNKINHNFSI